MESKTVEWFLTLEGQQPSLVKDVRKSICTTCIKSAWTARYGILDHRGKSIDRMRIVGKCAAFNTDTFAANFRRPQIENTGEFGSWVLIKEIIDGEPSDVFDSVVMCDQYDSGEES